jgi:hypothetical protein
MTDRRSFAWRLALGLTAHAAKILPPERREWSQAMLNEVDYLPSAGGAIRWALGCIFAGYIDRMNTMNRSLRNISPWVLCLEMLICFVPVTLFFAAVISSSMRGAWSPRDALLYASAALIGPVGLAVAIRIVVLRKVTGRAIAAASCALAVWTVVSYLAILNGQVADTSDWRSLALIALLPALATAHLAFIASETRSPRAPA